MWNHNKGNRDPARTNHRLTGKSCKTRSIWKSLRSLLQKDFRMMRSGKFFAVALGSLLLYTLFIHFAYVRFMDMEIYQVYLYDPAGTQRNVSPLVHPVASLEEMDRILHKDANSVGIHVTDGKPEVSLYTASKKLDRHRSDYALSLLHPGGKYTPETVGGNNLEQKNRRDITCELLFIEIVAVGFLGIASVLFKEKQMGVMRVHAILPLPKSLFLFSKIFLFLATDLVFAILLVLCNVGLSGTGKILPGLLIQTTILSLVMALTVFGCAMILKDFRQFSLAYLVIALFVTAPVFLSANTSIKMTWIRFHPFYHIYMGLKHAFFGIPVANPLYYLCAAGAVVLLFGIVKTAFCREMEKEG